MEAPGSSKLRCHSIKNRLNIFKFEFHKRVIIKTVSFQDVTPRSLAVYIDPEDGSSRLFQNFGKYLPDCTVSFQKNNLNIFRFEFLMAVIIKTGFVGYNAVYSGRWLRMFRRNLLPTPSGKIRVIISDCTASHRGASRI